MIHMNENLEEYDNPQQYDRENQYDVDTQWLIQFANRLDHCQHIIDLACGTGRIAIPLAQQGYTVTGIDLHAGMLQEAKHKAQLAGVPETRLQWLEQDCCNFYTPHSADLLLMNGNAFQHFHTNEQQDQLLRAISSHLRTDGYMVMDMRFPSNDELMQPEGEDYWKTVTDAHTGLPVDLYTLSSYDALQQMQHYITIRKFRDIHGTIQREERSNIYLRYTYPQELERLLASHGLAVIHRYQDWNGTPLTKNASQMIYVCRKR
ncbi:class I SAM-dependent methyltransferase [Paenibacillus kandeliae]|uniref:class I SAM-dependent methyltransferase n=1 Tax=Paenibacillus kandeliae TaxID=3231269 RepID=UPI003459F3A6